jgi:hypothetical protein
MQSAGILGKILEQKEAGGVVVGLVQMIPLLFQHPHPSEGQSSASLIFTQSPKTEYGIKKQNVKMRIILFINPSKIKLYAILAMIITVINSGNMCQLKSGVITQKVSK